jgi:NADH-quinone oxidoreductase subunit F
MGKTTILVGYASCGIAAGAGKVYETLDSILKNENADFELKQTGCVGMCFREPLIEVIDDTGAYLYGGVDEEKAMEIYTKHVKLNEPVREHLVRTDLFDTGDEGFFRRQIKIALRNCGVIDPEKIGEYIGTGGYEAINKILQENLTQEEVIQMILDSGLRGRGGGGFPTGMKWKFAYNSPGEKKYVICNADEGDPGAFMDRSLLEGDPHAVIEGMIIGAYCIGASEGVIYCRAEYPWLSNVSILPYLRPVKRAISAKIYSEKRASILTCTSRREQVHLYVVKRLPSLPL